MTHEEWNNRMIAEKKWNMVDLDALLTMADNGELSPEAGQELTKRVRQMTYPKTNKNNQQVEFVGRLLEDFVNNTICPKQELAEYMTSYKVHRTNQQSFFGLVMAFIRSYASIPDNCIDGRNQSACMAARQLMALIEENEVPVSFMCV